MFQFYGRRPTSLEVDVDDSQDKGHTSIHNGATGTSNNDAELGHMMGKDPLPSDTTLQSMPILFSPSKQNEIRKRAISPNKELASPLSLTPLSANKSFFPSRRHNFMSKNSSPMGMNKKRVIVSTNIFNKFKRLCLYMLLLLVGYLSILYFGTWQTTLHASPNNEKSELTPVEYTYTNPDSGDIVVGTILRNPKSQQGQDHPRVVFYATPEMSKFPSIGKHPNISDPLLTTVKGIPQQDHVPYVIGDCVPMQQWQVESRPTCNIMHEFDLSSMGRYIAIVNEEIEDGENKEWEEKNTLVYRMDRFSILGRGWFRHTWKGTSGYPGEKFVVKTLRLEREFYDEYFDLHRRDAVAMERLTHSPHILNVYGYCGQSAINEFAEFIEGYNDFEDFAKKVRGENSAKMMEVKMKIATEIARGMQHIHEIDGPNNATMVHYDINPKNIAITKGLNAKINDFNVAEFMRWNVATNKTCKFPGRFREPWWRSPEEMKFSSSSETNHNEMPLLDEKVDIYSLGNVLLNLLTGHSPRGRTSKSKVDSVREKVRSGVKPTIPKMYQTSDNKIVKAMLEAIDLCFEPNPDERASARDIVKILEVEIDRQIKKKKT